MDLPSPPSYPTPPRLPIELCELIIDTLGHDYTGWAHDADGRALQSCALVSRAWRPRAQLHLFAHIAVNSFPALERLACALRADPALRAFVHSLHLDCSARRSMYPARNIATLFPSMLARRDRLPALREVRISGGGLAEHTPIAGAMVRARMLPHLPVPLRTAGVYAPIARTATRLVLYKLEFANFADFARLLDAFAILEELECKRVTWATLGIVPGFVTRKKGGGRTGGGFLERLRVFNVRPNFISPLCTASLITCLLVVEGHDIRRGADPRLTVARLAHRARCMVPVRATQP